MKNAEISAPLAIKTGRGLRLLKRVAIVLGAAIGISTLSGPAAAQSDEPVGVADLGIPRSAPSPDAPSVEQIDEPLQFVTDHQAIINGQKLRYKAIAGETFLYSAGGPTASIFSFSYIAESPDSATRPVAFVFNGGPGSSSVWLHLGVVGPRRVVLDQEINTSPLPPFGLADNPHSILDVADIVFIDPVGTGWSRAIGAGKSEDFWGVNEDVNSIAQFIENWLTEHGRWNSPKYIIGESYGSLRASLLPRALMGGPFFGGVMRGITVNGIVLLGTSVEAREANGFPKAEMREALELPAMADTSWYHNRIDRAGMTIEEFHQAAVRFATTEYAQALEAEKAGTLIAAERIAIVDRLMALTGLPRENFNESLALPVSTYADSILADQGLEVGIYDSRFTLPLAGSGNDPVADDPAMARFVPGFVSAFHQLTSEDLKIDVERPYGAIVWKDVYPSWNWDRSPLPQTQSFATDLAVAMRRTPGLEVLVASGYYDLATHSATAEHAIMSADPPADRISFERYPSGHMLYLGDTAAAFAEDIRALIRRTQDPQPAQAAR